MPKGNECCAQIYQLFVSLICQQCLKHEYGEQQEYGMGFCQQDAPV